MNSPNSSSRSLSVQFEQHYGCKLSGDLADWFDEAVGKNDGGNEYRLAIDPKELLVDAPEAIWPCLMPCDFLPLIGSGEGDWLGVRVDADNNASEIIQWYHGGGDWIPWGRTLAEAVLLDAIYDRLPGPKRRHAIPAEPIARRPASENAWVDWALDHLPTNISECLSPGCSPERLVELLIENEVAEIAVRCELVQEVLQEPLSSTLTAKRAIDLGYDVNETARWMFDVDLIPESTRERLKSDLELPAEIKQDWRAAARHCVRVTEIAPNLAWAWDILGYSLEKSGEKNRAIDSYRQGALQSVFTAQSVRLKTHWAMRQSAKFSTSRLLELDKASVENDLYLRLLAAGNDGSRRQAVKEYHLSKVSDAGVVGDAAMGCQTLLAAGWDLGAEPLAAYGDILKRVVELADAAGQTARSRVARTHLSCFESRYVG